MTSPFHRTLNTTCWCSMWELNCLKNSAKEDNSASCIIRSDQSEKENLIKCIETYCSGSDTEQLEDIYHW